MSRRFCLPVRHDSHTRRFAVDSRSSRFTVESRRRDPNGARGAPRGGRTGHDLLPRVPGANGGGRTARGDDARPSGAGRQDCPGGGRGGPRGPARLRRRGRGPGTRHSAGNRALRPGPPRFEAPTRLRRRTERTRWKARAFAESGPDASPGAARCSESRRGRSRRTVWARRGGSRREAAPRSC